MKQIITFKIQKKFLDKILSGEKKYEYRFLTALEYDVLSYTVFYQHNRIFNVGFFNEGQFYLFEKTRIIKKYSDVSKLLQFMKKANASKEEIDFVMKLSKQNFRQIVVFEIGEKNGKY